MNPREFWINPYMNDDGDGEWSEVFYENPAFDSIHVREVLPDDDYISDVSAEMTLKCESAEELQMLKNGLLDLCEITDTERLEWMIEKRKIVVRNLQKYCILDDEENAYNSPREAIDAAMNGIK